MTDHFSFSELAQFWLDSNLVFVVNLVITLSPSPPTDQLATDYGLTMPRPRPPSKFTTTFSPHGRSSSLPENYLFLIWSLSSSPPLLFQSHFDIFDDNLFFFNFHLILEDHLVHLDVIIIIIAIISKSRCPFYLLLFLGLIK